MDTPNDWTTIVVVALVLALVIGVFIWISVRVRKGGGSMTTIAMGATEEFLSSDQAKAIETVVEENAGKRMETQGDVKPKD